MVKPVEKFADPITCPHCGKKSGDGRSVGGFKTHIRFCGVTLAEHLWSRVRKTDGCWLFTGAINTTGYGMVSLHGKKNQPAHRISWELVNGPIPKGLFALHKCDTPRCVRPDHLFLGTDADNSTDKARKGRAGIKLTAEKARAIKAMLAQNVLQYEIAAQFGVTPAIVSAIHRGRIWRFA